MPGAVTRVLFILKRREDFNPVKHNPMGLSTGLYNSASYIVNMLNYKGVHAKLDVAIDNNCIDRLVTQFKPTHVVVEAMWVTPAKFAELVPLHPTVKWIVRLHSETPFIAGEGMAMNWLGDYMTNKNILIACNAPRMLEEVKMILKLKGKSEDKAIYLPNYYPQWYRNRAMIDRKSEYVNVACFGAVRPLKNHLLQALAALKFAGKIKRKLKFHINGGRQEMKGEPIMQNLKNLFLQIHSSGHELVIHEWEQREKFLNLCSSMDVGMQCSYSETFNIVAADLVSQGVPIVCSEEVPWISSLFSAKPSSCDDMANSLLFAYKFPKLNLWYNRGNLKSYTNKSEKIWLEYFK